MWVDLKIRPHKVSTQYVYVMVQRISLNFWFLLSSFALMEMY